MKGSPIAKIGNGLFFFSKATFKAEHLWYLYNINNKKKQKRIFNTAKKPSYKIILFLSLSHLNKGTIILPRQTCP